MAEIKILIDGKELEESKEVQKVTKELNKTNKQKLLGFLQGLAFGQNQERKMAAQKQITKQLKITKTNIAEMREIVGAINQKLDEASALIEQLASIELKIDVDID